MFPEWEITLKNQRYQRYHCIVALIEIENSRDGIGLLANGSPNHTGLKMEKNL